MMIGEPGIPFNEAGWPKALEDDDGPDDRNQKIIEFAYRLRREDENEALMSGGPVILPELSEYLERAAAIVAADEANEAFGTTCVDCGRAIGDEDETVPDEDGNLLHVGCGDRP